jgi:pyridoxal phosphate enzyme (YggS family)
MNEEASSDSVADIRNRLERIQDRIGRAAAAGGRDGDAVIIVAASKTHPVEALQAAFDAGIERFGENRIQEGVPKVEALPAACWHFIGHLQRNKARDAVEHFAVIESIDSVSLAERVSQLASQRGSGPLRVLLEINATRDPSKFGFRSEDLPAAAESILALPALNVEGLMTVGPLTQDPEMSRQCFMSMANLRNFLASRYPEACWDKLSMGMSDDFEIAIEQGATEIRLGRCLFGERRLRA